MATAKKSPIQTAVDLLKKNGYAVTKKRADPRIGDVVRFRDEKADLLITFHQTDRQTPDDSYTFGGVIVGRNVYAKLYVDNLWIDRNEWAKDDGQYEVIGHVNLDKYVKE